jgi:hypothetical protein
MADHAPYSPSPRGGLSTRRSERLDDRERSDCRRCYCGLLLQLIMRPFLDEGVARALRLELRGFRPD